MMSRATTRTMSRMFLFIGHVLLSSIWFVTADIKAIDIYLTPAADQIIYSRGHIHAPGSLDLSSLTLLSSEIDEGQAETKIDIAIFREPKTCMKSESSCDWTDAGVGFKDPATKQKFWCCSDDAISLQHCTEDRRGRLIFRDGNSTKSKNFQGSKIDISILPNGIVRQDIKNATIQETESGYYIVAFANCDEKGRPIHVTGHVDFLSSHGYLPVTLYEFMIFLAALTFFYILLSAWFGLLMRYNKESYVPMETWILMTMLVGLSDSLLRLGLYFEWNQSGTQSLGLYYGSLTADAVKRGFNLVLKVMAAHGWGMVTDTLGRSVTIVLSILGTCYILSSALRECLQEYMFSNWNNMTIQQRIFFTRGSILFRIVETSIDIFFLVWILYALHVTLRYLEQRRQLPIRPCLILFFVLLERLASAAIFSFTRIFAIAFSDSTSSQQEQVDYFSRALAEVKYFLILFGIAYLWRPREYVRVMSLSQNSSEVMDDEEIEVELSETVGLEGAEVNNDSSRDDEKATSPIFQENGFMAAHDERFQIDDDAEIT